MEALDAFTERFFKKLHQSKRAFRKARKLFPGGVNSPVRAFKAVGSTPIFIKRGKQSNIYDIDGNKYIDFCMSWGALIHGHAHPKTVKAVSRQAANGLSFGACTTYENDLAELIIGDFPNLEQVRFTNSGTEAVMSAIRLARGFTNRSRIVKFAGCYHGHSDSLLVKAGSGLATFSTPDSAGITPQNASETIVLPYNDISALERVFSKSADIACVIVEPIAGNMGMIRAQQHFLQTLRTVTSKSRSLLIFDEVISGYRAGAGGAARIYGIQPDLMTLGKVIGGGMPIGLFGGKKHIMQHLAPLGSVYQAGTLSGNPVAMAAGLAALKDFRKTRESKLSYTTERFCHQLEQTLSAKGMPVQIPRVGSMFGIFFQPERPLDFASISQNHVRLYTRFFCHMTASGFLLPPSAYETMFLSTAHKWWQLESFINAAADFNP